MKLPFIYALKNIFRRPWRSLMTVCGMTITVFSAILMLSLYRGIGIRSEASGLENNVLAISRNGQNVMFSSITEEELVHLWTLPGILKGQDGTPLVSAEIIQMSHAIPEGLTRAHRAPISVRGVSPLAYEVHREVRVTEGRLPEKDFEIIAGKMAHVRLGIEARQLATGAKIKFENEDWTVCGRFESGGSLFEAEMWTGKENLKAVLKRQSVSFVVIAFESPVAAREACSYFNRTGAVQKYFKGWTEKGYYREYAKTLSWLKWLSIVMVISVTIAGLMIGVNTMFSAVIGRLRELGTLRVLGFSKFDIFISLLTESLLLSIPSGLLGGAVGFLLNNLPIKLSNNAFSLTVDGHVFLSGLMLSVIIGLLGVSLASLKGFRMNILEALRTD